MADHGRDGAAEHRVSTTCHLLPVLHARARVRAFEAEGDSLRLPQTIRVRPLPVWLV